MSTSVPLTSKQMTDLFFTVLKSLAKFDQLEVHGVIGGLLSPSDREKCFIATYRRTTANVSTLLGLTEPKHFQAIAMLSRALFELAVDIRLLEALPQSCERMIAFVNVEKLRCARKVLQFKADHQGSNVDTTTFASFVTNNGASVDAEKATLWPNMQKVSHWSGRDLRSRVKLLKAPFQEIYDVYYPSLSWHVHSGLTGVINLQAETFALICGQAFKLAADSYWETLSAMIDEFKLAKGNKKIQGKMQAAKMLPFTDSPLQAEQLLQELTS
jgi:hypothetical protein